MKNKEYFIKPDELSEEELTEHIDQAKRNLAKSGGVFVGLDMATWPVSVPPSLAEKFDDLIKEKFGERNRGWFWRTNATLAYIFKSI